LFDSSAVQDGRLHSGDHLLQIGEINVRGMGSEQVASVLRQSGTHVHLIVARGIIEPPVDFPPYAPIIPTVELTEHLRQLNEALLLNAPDFPGYIVPPEPPAGLIPNDNPTSFQTVLPAEIHPVSWTCLAVCYRAFAKCGVLAVRMEKNISIINI